MSYGDGVISGPCLSELLAKATIFSALNRVDPKMIALDPNDSSYHRNPYPIYASLRNCSPVAKVLGQDGQQEWYITRYTDIEALLKHKDRLLKDKTKLRSGHLSRHASIQNLFLRPIVFRDPPDHSRLRGLVQKAFIRRNITSLEDSIVNKTALLLSGLRPGQTVDLVPSLAKPLPLSTIADLLGVQEADQLQLADWANALFEATEPEMLRPSQKPRLFKKLQAFARYLRREFKYRQQVPNNGLISALIQVRENDDLLSTEELFNMVSFLLVAGVETVTNHITNSVVSLLANPQQKTALIEQKIDLNTAIEELLRFDAPIKTSTRRWAAMDFTLHDQLIKRGDIVRLVFASANRDERVFSEPNRLDLSRTVNRHLALGAGIHHCLGAWLGRVQGRIALQQLFDRFPRLRLACEPEQLIWRQSVLLRGVVALPVILE